MANAGELKLLNNSMEAELKAKNFNSPNIICNLKKAKVPAPLGRSPSIVNPISSTSRKSISRKQVVLF